eukprot:TRINITY_DN3526_c0_g1_i1.p2 TRINITY_DN3526_c0_g1~~TRINITY_DN3526_c0_g1_i1.p2  ORF type:complete len:112 (-),score=7.28 TRINITY_DN3526_c0_g1_i1:83-418(-)
MRPEHDKEHMARGRMQVGVRVGVAVESRGSDGRKDSPGLRGRNHQVMKYVEFSTYLWFVQITFSKQLIQFQFSKQYFQNNRSIFDFENNIFQTSDLVLIFKIIFPKQSIYF